MDDPGTILVGVDGSDRDRDALVLTGWLARALGARVLAVHAHPFGPLSGLLASGEYEQLVRRVAERVGAHATRYLADLDVEMQLIADPSPAASLHRLARERAVRITVVGSSERGRIGIITLGSTTERIVSGSPCPVAVAPRGYTGARAEPAIGVGFDGSEDARVAVDLAAELAGATGAILRLIAVFEPVVWPVSEYGPLPQEPANETLRAGLRERVREAAQAAQAAQAADLTVHAEVVDGDPLRTLAERSAALDALVVGSRGYGPVRSILLGGVSGRIIREATCPVLVCPRDAGA